MTAILMTIFIASVPLIELRGAIPVALGVYHLSPFTAWFFAVFGNIIPIFILYFAIDYLFTKKSHWKLIQWIKHHSLKKVGPSYEKYGNIALFLFVAVPLPLTGVYTATAAAVLLGMPRWKATFWMAAGVMVAGLLMVLGSLGIIHLI